MKISVIVPVYNVEKYLAKCLDSILMQSYRDIEVILVDDGSPDKCPQICDAYADSDSRVKVIHKKNGGLSDARNAGLKVAVGEYVAFVDSDDWVHEAYIKELVLAAKSIDADVAVCDYQSVNEFEVIEVKLNRAKPREFDSISAVKDIFSADTVLWVMTWNKLYRRSLFTEHKIEFPTGKIHEDNFTTYKLLYFANKIAYIGKPLYYYLKREGSIMSDKFNKRRLDVLEALDKTEKFIDLYNIPVWSEFDNYRLMTYISLLDGALSAQRHGTAYTQAMVKRIRQVSPKALTNSRIKFLHKAMAALVSISPSLYFSIKSLIKRAH